MTEIFYQEIGDMEYSQKVNFTEYGKTEYGKEDNLTAIGLAVSKNNFQKMKKRKLETKELSEVVFSDEKIKINKVGEIFVFEIGNETTLDIAEGVAIMMNMLDNNHSIWNLEFKTNEDKITPEKSLYWLTGGHIEWKHLEYYDKNWSDCYLIFQEEFGISIVNIIKNSKKLKDIREEFKKCLNLPVMYEFALSQNLVK